MDNNSGCSVLTLNSDFIKKLEILKILMNEKEDEIVDMILNDISNEKYLRIKDYKIKNGSNWDRLRDNL